MVGPQVSNVITVNDIKKIQHYHSKLGSLISSDLRFSCSFSNASNLIHLNNLANTYIFLPRKFRTKIQKALDISYFLSSIQLLWDTKTEEQFWGI